jgi:hypothetical protein
MSIIMNGPGPWDERLRKWMSWSAVIGTPAFSVAYGTLIVWKGFGGFWNEALQAHIPKIIGLPVAVAASLGIVLVLRTVAGAIEFKA